MNKFFIYSFFLLFIICCSLYIFKLNATPAITYFPPAEEFNFDKASTNLTLHEDGKEIIWTSNSKSNDTLYLRQDISLLYMNGIFKGVQSKWERQVDKIHLKKIFPYKNEGYMQSISFHHGEVHSSDKQINSIQTMSAYQAILSSNDHEIQLEHIPNNQFSPSLLSIPNHQYLLTTWRSILDEYQTDPKAYDIIPFIELVNYNESPLPNMTMEQTNQIIGQLWEGLYKNYVIPLTKEKNATTKDVMPLILFSKDGTHLVVLFEIDGKKEKLYQAYPPF